jgi:hypothetical protein
LGRLENQASALHQRKSHQTKWLMKIYAYEAQEGYCSYKQCPLRYVPISSSEWSRYCPIEQPLRVIFLSICRRMNQRT